METKRPRSACLLALAGLLFLAGPLLLYVSGYFSLSTPVMGVTPTGPLPPRITHVIRIFRYPWLAQAYQPLGMVEAGLMQREVYVTTPGEDPWKMLWAR